MQARFYYRYKDAPTPNKPNHIGAAAVIVNGKNEILFEKRSDSGRWALIGGGLKINETLAQCCAREIYEETGLTATDLRLYKLYDDPSRIVAYPDGNILRIITAVYLTTVKDGAQLKISEESKELKFFPTSQLKDLDIVETHRHIVEDILRLSIV